MSLRNKLFRGYSTTVSASACQTEDASSILATRSKYATTCYVTVP